MSRSGPSVSRVLYRVCCAKSDHICYLIFIVCIASSGNGRNPLAIFGPGSGPRTRIRDWDRRLDAVLGSGQDRPCRYIGLVVLRRMLAQLRAGHEEEGARLIGRRGYLISAEDQLRPGDKM